MFKGRINKKRRDEVMKKLSKDVKPKDFLKAEIKKYGGTPLSNDLISLARQHAYVIRRVFKGKTIEERICNRRRALRYTEIELRRTIKEVVG